MSKPDPRFTVPWSSEAVQEPTHTQQRSRRKSEGGLPRRLRQPTIAGLMNRQLDRSLDITHFADGSLAGDLALDDSFDADLQEAFAGVLQNRPSSAPPGLEEHVPPVLVDPGNFFDEIVEASNETQVTEITRQDQVSPNWKNNWMDILDEHGAVLHTLRLNDFAPGKQGRKIANSIDPADPALGWVRRVFEIYISRYSATALIASVLKKLEQPSVVFTIGPKSQTEKTPGLNIDEMWLPPDVATDPRVWCGLASKLQSEHGPRWKKSTVYQDYTKLRKQMQNCMSAKKHESQKSRENQSQRKRVESLTVENKRLKLNNEALQREADALRSRNDMITAELTHLKARFGFTSND